MIILTQTISRFLLQLFLLVDTQCSICTSKFHNNNNNNNFNFNPLIISSVYMILFFISSMSFVTFSFNPNVPSFRGIVCAILLMAPVNFRWSATQLLPSVRYLTKLDQYGLGNMIISILVMCWNALIGSSLIKKDLDSKRIYDKIALIILGSFSLLFNVYFLTVLGNLYMSRRKVEDKIESMLDNDTLKFRKLLQSKNNNGRRTMIKAVKMV
jgi:hypothetical protein